MAVKIVAERERKLSLQRVSKQNLLHHQLGLNLSQIQHRDKQRKIAQMIQNKVIIQ